MGQFSGVGVPNEPPHRVNVLSNELSRFRHRLRFFLAAEQNSCSALTPTPDRGCAFCSSKHSNASPKIGAFMSNSDTFTRLLRVTTTGCSKRQYFQQLCRSSDTINHHRSR